jgi:hypothetical protein
VYAKNKETSQESEEKKTKYFWNFTQKLFVDQTKAVSKRLKQICDSERNLPDSKVQTNRAIDERRSANNGKV